MTFRDVEAQAHYIISQGWLCYLSSSSLYLESKSCISESSLNYVINILSLVLVF